MENPGLQVYNLEWGKESSKKAEITYLRGWRKIKTLGEKYQHIQLPQSLLNFYLSELFSSLSLMVIKLQLSFLYFSSKGPRIVKTVTHVRKDGASVYNIQYAC